MNISNRAIIVFIAATAILTSSSNSSSDCLERIQRDVTYWLEYVFPTEEAFWWGLGGGDCSWHLVSDGKSVKAYDHVKHYIENSDYKYFTVLKFGTNEVLVVMKPQYELVTVRSDKGTFKVPRSSFHFEVDDGYFFALNRGEWGGEVWFFPKDQTVGYKVSDDQLAKIVELDYRILGFDGIAHLSLDQGKVVEFVLNAEGRWTSQYYYPLTSAPEIVVQEDESSCFVVTNKQVLLFREGTSPKVIADNLHFGGVYPQNLVKDADGNLLIGVRHALVKISDWKQDTPRLSLLLPNKEFARKAERWAKARADSPGFRLTTQFSGLESIQNHPE